MTLEKYERKRDFTRTSEPKPGAAQGKGPLIFIIQKHKARHLHYDFRFELDGVLKSWAIPKGPSLDPSKKRLAVMVEDHPLDYQEFEGVIPEGNYGAGAVIVWDRGHVFGYGLKERAESEQRFRDGLKNGHLTLILDGTKLKGEFGLVRIGDSGSRNWLLIKKGDDFARKDLVLDDISVLTGRSLEELDKHGQKDSLKIPEQAVKAGIPAKVGPMLCETSPAPFDRKGWFFEVKWDGYRAISTIRKDKAEIYSRKSNALDLPLSDIRSALVSIQKEAVIDGEIVALDKDGKSNFQKLQNARSDLSIPLAYYVFDLVYYDGYDLKAVPLRLRKELLREVLPSSPFIRFSDHIERNGTAFFDLAQQNNLEGIIAKDASSPYLPGVRSQSWLKIKTSLRQEAVIAGYTPSPSPGRAFSSLVLGAFKDGSLHFIGLCGGGFSGKAMAELVQQMKPISSKQAPFLKLPELGREIIWVKPLLVAEIRFSQWTSEGRMRHPVFLGLRPDKEPEEVLLETESALT